MYNNRFNLTANLWHFCFDLAYVITVVCLSAVQLAAS
ncbi:DUF3265 domain-containing protein [Vibrio vulnificus]|nr:DUF3265 domain-containing protein [Vibrio vulnificus]EGR0800006.1 DUF3265 domain-containing protein [Vibrio vulnificus]EGR0817381.1 DUF3265 domain-containing protein [Vibrio vulnificus]EGR0829423.1 DUF3265 domain-containing protein [Vibrio vulnificus]EGR0849891.1 DUF3265 domain-containing protein [Vibrio vulnificus]